MFDALDLQNGKGCMKQNVRPLLKEILIGRKNVKDGSLHCVNNAGSWVWTWRNVTVH